MSVSAVARESVKHFVAGVSKFINTEWNPSKSSVLYARMKMGSDDLVAVESRTRNEISDREAALLCPDLILARIVSQDVPDDISAIWSN